MSGLCKPAKNGRKGVVPLYLRPWVVNIRGRIAQSSIAFSLERWRTSEREGSLGGMAMLRTGNGFHTEMHSDIDIHNA